MRIIKTKTRTVAPCRERKGTTVKEDHLGFRSFSRIGKRSTSLVGGGEAYMGICYVVPHIAFIFEIFLLIFEEQK